MQEIGNRLGTCRKASRVALVVKNLPVNAGDIRDVGSIPGLGRSPGEGHSNPLQYSCLENPMDRGVWRATVHRVAKSQTQLKQLSMHVPNERATLGSDWRLCRRRVLTPFFLSSDPLSIHNPLLSSFSHFSGKFFFFPSRLSLSTFFNHCSEKRLRHWRKLHPSLGVIL